MKPLTIRASQNSSEKFALISFESKPLALDFNLPENLTIQIIKKSFFLTRSIKAVKKNNYNFDSVIARGPIAGYIAIKAGLKNITVQARGVLTEEYQLAHANDKLIKKLISNFRENYYRKIEVCVYTNRSIKIEAVSEALRNFLCQRYKAVFDNIYIAELDIPQAIEPAKLTEWKLETRSKLNFQSNEYVICYSGSVKPWQHPKDLVPFLKNQLNEKSRSRLIILTDNILEFEIHLEKENVEKNRYVVTSCNHSEVYKYLAAANAGVIFRDKHIVNWVSRPTKALEYQAAGLEVIHNGTVDFLNQMFSNDHQSI